MTVAMTLTLAASGTPETDAKYSACRVNTRVGDKTESISLPCSQYPGSAADGDAVDAAEAAREMVKDYIQPYTAARVQSITSTLYRNTNASVVPADAAGAGGSYFFIFEYFLTTGLPTPARAAMKIPHFTGDGSALFALWNTPANAAGIKLRLLIAPVASVDSSKTVLVDHKGGRNIT